MALLWSGTLLTVLGLMMTSLSTRFWHFLLAQGLSIGVGNGLLYLPDASIISQYFARRKAFAFGLASLGSSFGMVS